ncbi:MAG: LPD38 domain-containing protein [Sulfurimonas sp.]|uniref:LPD38 domain-containing protein n=1 Tax=Sulfurimonas sp. TaxID=2022749 RepID=UPI0028CDA6E2|nr:LPD38 domain-containing protein [Sulfurimonas sp.]MDT8337567.1 LPD38 domain-containing protein [Sulfurimonas sp.]
MKQIDIFSDKDFQSLDLSKKQTITTNYFDTEMADAEFLALDAQEQTRIKENFVNAQLDFDVSDTLDKGVSAIERAFAPVYKEDTDVTDPALHNAVAPNRDGSLPIQTKAATAEKPFMIDALTSDIVQTDDVTATREFKPAMRTAVEIFNDTPARMISPAEQDAQTIEANKRTISMGENQDYVNPEASEWELGKRVVNRVNELTANAIQGTYNLLGNIKTPMEYLGITTEALDAQNKKRADWFKNASDKLNDFVYEKNKMELHDGSIVQKPTHSWEEVKKGFSSGGVFDVDAWQELGNYIGSEGVVSAPDMAEMVAAMPLYYAARQQESAEHRAENNNRKEPTANDYLMTAPTTMGSIILDRLGLKATTEDVVKSVGKDALDGSLKDAITTVGKQMQKGFVVEGTTESLQNPIEKFGEEVGTEKGLSSPAEYADDALAGFVAGSGAGAGISGATATGTEIFNTLSQAKQEKAREAYVQDAYNKQVLGSGLVTTVDDAGYINFSNDLRGKVKTIQDEFQNLVINHPEQVVPVEAVDSVEMQEQIVADAKANGLNVSDNNGLNAIDTGWNELRAELSSNPLQVDEELKPKGFADAPTVDTARLQELQEKTDDELTQDEKFELEDLSASVNETATSTPAPVIEKPVIGEPEPEAKADVNDINVVETKEAQDTEFTELQNHPRYKSLLDMRKDIYAKDAASVNNLVQAGAGRELDGHGGTDKNTYDKAQYERNYRADFLLTKSDITRLGKGEIDTELLAKLKADLGVLDNSPEYAASQYDNFVQDEYARAYGILSTATKTKQGTQNSLAFEGTRNALFDTTASTEYIVPEWAKGIVNSVVKYEDVITAITNAKNGKHSELSDRVMEQLHRAGSPHLAEDIKRFNELQANWNLNELEEQEASALARLLDTYLEEEENGKYNRDPAANTKTDAGTLPTETKSDTTLQEPTSKGTYAGESKGANDRGVSGSSDAKIIFDTTKVYTTKGIMNEIPSREVSKKLQKDVAKYVQQLQKALGGWEVAVDKKGKPLSYMGVSNNLAPAGGSVSFKLYKPNSDIGVYVSLGYDLIEDGIHDAYTMGDDMRLTDGQLYRTTNKATKKDGSNRWIKNSKLTSSEFVRDIMDIVEREENRGNENRGNDAGSQTVERTNNTAGVPTSKQNTLDTKTNQGSDKSVSEGDRRPDGLGTNGSTQDEVSNGYGGVDGYKTDGGNKQPKQQTTDANRVLPRSDEPNSTESYSLEGRTPVELTKGQRKKFNDATLEIIKKPLEEITEADREILRHYTGEGGLGEANENSVNQHYTNYATVQSIYKALADADVPMDKILEPAVGSGNFVGFMPNASWDVVDIDTTNIEITKRLYPQIKNFFADTYETFEGKNYDLIVSNVPFASTEMLMREHAMTIKPAFKAIHNFYFAHSMDKVKENGVIAFMTSTGTMDGTTTARHLRKYLMDRGDIIGAFRLPEKSQAKNAHTDTMIDIIFIQKRPEGVKSRQEDVNNQFVNIGNKDGFAMNEYLLQHPENLLGDEVVVANDKTKMGKEGWIVRGEPKFENIKISYEPYKIAKKTQDEQHSFKNVEEATEYAAQNKIPMKLVSEAKPHSEFADGKMVYYAQELSFSDTSKKAMFGEVLKGDNAQKALLLEKIKMLTEDGLRLEDKTMINTALAEIQNYKQRFEKSPHNDLALKKFMKEHRSDIALKESMSYFDKDFTPAPIYGEQTRFKDSGVLEVDANSPLIERALFYSTGDTAIDTSKEYDYLSKEDMQELVKNRSYVRSGVNEIQLDFMYYSGNVYAKLDSVEGLRKYHGLSIDEYNEQYIKLKAIVPEQIPFKNITVKGGESWLPNAVRDAISTEKSGELFVRSDVFDGDGMKAELYNRYLNKKALAPKGKDESDQENIQRTMEATKLLSEVLVPQVMQYIEKQGLAEILTDEYNRYSNFYVRPEMTGVLLRELPKTFRDKSFAMQSHQLQGAEKLVFNKKGVLAFAPGGGKTITAIVAVMNLIGQGVMKKPLFVVPVNTIAQWENSVKELYPHAAVFEFPKVKSGVNKGNAKEWTQLSREEKEQMAFDLANNRYDFTIIGDTMFQKFGLPSDVMSEYVDDLVEQIQAIEEVEAGDTKSKKKGVSAEAKKRALKNGLKQAYGSDVEFDFAKMGFDGLIADEVQYYKNIGLGGKDIKGGLGASVVMSYSDKNGKALTAKDILEGAEPHSATLGSMRSYDFRFKSKYVSQNNNGNNVILLTGTPTPNKPLELYTLLQHLDESILYEYGIVSSRDFVDTFYDIEELETTDSAGKIVKREALASMKNLDWMGKILDRFVDYKGFKDMPELPRPKQVDVQHYLKLSSAGEKIFQDVQHRILAAMEDAKKIKSGLLDSSEVEIALVAMGAGRSASIDLRLYDVGTKGKSQFTPDDLFDVIDNDIATSENNKILKTIELITNQYKENSNSGQIIFLDRLSVKNSDGSVTSTHAETREKILATGLFDEKEVVFVNGAAFVNPTTGKVSKSSIKPDMLNKIMDMYNNGDIKVIIGNTSKLGVGVDLNRKTTDIYQLDIPFRPDEIEQRSNRGVRQGNENTEVRVHQFFQLGTFDKRSYDIVMKKRGFNDMYKFSENEDLVVVDGVSIIDNSNTTDPYQAVIDLERDPFERERLRKQRVIENAVVDANNLKNIITKLDADIKTKQGSIKNYSDAIKGADENLMPQNFPKYEGIKDEAEKKEKLDKHIQGLVERKAKYENTIQGIEVEIAEIEAKANERKEQKASHEAETKFITDEFTNDGKNVSIDKIKTAYTLEQILKSEGKSAAEIESYLADREPETISYSKKPTPKEQKQIEETNFYARANGYDEAGINYVPNYSVSGIPSRPLSDTITLNKREVKLPAADKPINADSLRIYVSDIIGNRLYDGKIKGKSALGIYKRKDSSIRLKNYSDVEIMAHEMAHYLDFFHNNKSKDAKDSFFRSIILKNKEEVKALSYTTDPKKVINEGFAEFVRLWLTNYNTLTLVAPNMVKDFEARLAKDKNLQAKMEMLQIGMHQFYYQGAAATLRSKQGGELNSTAKKIQRSQAEISKDIRQAAIDKVHSIKRIEAAIRGDVATDAIESPYKILQLAEHASSLMHTAMHFGVPSVKANGDITYSGKALNDIFAPATKVSEERVRLLSDYLVAMRASELKGQGRENLITEQEIDAGLLLAQKYPEFETIFNEYQEFNDAMLDFYVGMNLITPEQKANFQEMNKNYVPFHRVTESVQNGAVPPAKIGQRLTGGTHSLGNIMENIIGGIESNIKQALISRGKSVFFKMLDDSDMGGVFATKVSAENKLVKSDIAQQAKKVAQLMAQLGITVAKDGMILSGDINADIIIDVNEIEQNLIDNPSALEFWTHGHKPTSQTGYIETVIINGKKIYFEVHDAALVDSLTSFGSANYNELVQYLMSAKNVMTWNITNNPLFYGTNFVRDTVSASVLSKNKFIPVVTSVRGMYHFVMKTDVYKNFMASGGGYGTRRTTLGGDVDAMGMLEVNRGFEVINKLLSAMAYGADTFEYGTRIGEFLLATNSGKSNMQAAFEGNEVSTDFTIKGSNRTWTGFLATVPFMKAGINGMDKTARRIFSLNGEMKLSNAVKFKNQLGELQAHKLRLYAAGGLISVITLALWSANRDDERYKKLTRDSKLMYWHFFIGDQHIKIPRPYDIGFAFATMPEIVADGIYTKHGKEAAADFVWGIKTMFSIGDVSGLFQPILEDMTNKNWTGGDIVPSYLENIDDKSDQYMNFTPLLYKKAGELTGASPILMQHYIDGYLGLTAKMVEETTENMLWNEKDWGARPFARNALEFLTYRFRGKEVETRTAYSEKYYELMRKAGGVKASFEAKKKKAFIDGGKNITEYMSADEKKAYVQVSRLMARYASKLTNIKNRVEHITYDKKLSKAEKEKRINAAYEKRTEIFKGVSETLEKELKKFEGK